MPKPYRRRKGKTGPYVGNFRCTVDGRDINLLTKDASEALARARLAAKGKWPPIEAAVEAARAALDPGASDPEPPELAGEPAGVGGGAPQPNTPETLGTHAPPPRESPSHEAAAPLNEAAAAAAAEATGDPAEKIEQQAEQANHVNTELAAVMAELSGGAGGGDLLDGLCDGAAAFILWAERKSIELGVNWTLERRKSKKRFKAGELEQGSLMRKALRVGLKGAAVTYFPDFATSLTPSWAIAIGMIGGATQCVMTGELVDTETGRSQAVGEAFAAAKAAAQEQAPQQPPPTA
jgi:hypothetical protein